MQGLSSLEIARAWVEFSNPVKNMDMPHAIVAHSQYREIFERCVKEVDIASKETDVVRVYEKNDDAVRVYAKIEEALTQLQAAVTHMTEGSVLSRDQSFTTDQSVSTNSIHVGDGGDSVTEPPHREMTILGDINAKLSALEKLFETDTFSDRLNRIVSNKLLDPLDEKFTGISDSVRTISNYARDIDTFKDIFRDSLFEKAEECLLEISLVSKELREYLDRMRAIDFDEMKQSIKANATLLNSKLNQLDNQYVNLDSKLDRKIKEVNENMSSQFDAFERDFDTTTKEDLQKLHNFDIRTTNDLQNLHRSNLELIERVDKLESLSVPAGRGGGNPGRGARVRGRGTGIAFEEDDPVY